MHFLSVSIQQRTGEWIKLLQANLLQWQQPQLRNDENVDFECYKSKAIVKAKQTLLRAENF